MFTTRYYSYLWTSFLIPSPRSCLIYELLHFTSLIFVIEGFHYVTLRKAAVTELGPGRIYIK
jgi:hypothetical protein